MYSRLQRCLLAVGLIAGALPAQAAPNQTASDAEPVGGVAWELARAISDPETGARVAQATRLTVTARDRTSRVDTRMDMGPLLASTVSTAEVLSAFTRTELPSRRRRADSPTAATATNLRRSAASRAATRSAAPVLQIGKYRLSKVSLSAPRLDLRPAPDGPAPQVEAWSADLQTRRMRDDHIEDYLDEDR